MTFAELVQESSMYEYSREYYELVKECAEITVMEQFVKSQKFIAENPKIVESVSKISDTNFFTESVSTDNIAMIESTISEKAKKAKDFILGKLSQLWNALTKMAASVWSKISGQDQAALRTKFINFINDNAFEVESFAKKAINIASKYDVICSSESKKNELIISKITANLDDKELIYLNSALTNDSFNIEGKYIPLEDLTKLVGDLLNSKNSDQLAAVSTLLNQVKNKNTLSIPINKKESDRIIKDMNKMKDDIDKALINKTEDYHAANSEAEFYSKFQYLTTEIFKYITNDINGLRNAAMFRSDVLKNFNAIVSGNDKFDKKMNAEVSSNEGN